MRSKSGNKDAIGSSLRNVSIAFENLSRSEELREEAEELALNLFSKAGITTLEITFLLSCRSALSLKFEVGADEMNVSNLVKRVLKFGTVEIRIGFLGTSETDLRAESFECGCSEYEDKKREEPVRRFESDKVDQQGRVHSRGYNSNSESLI